MVIKDDIRDFYLNKECQKDSEHPRTVPKGKYDYVIPLSMFAETCLSDYNEKKVKIVTKKDGVRNVDVSNMLADFADTSDFLYNAYSMAQKGKNMIKKFRKMKSVSPHRPVKNSNNPSTRQVRSPLRNNIATTQAS